MNKVSGDDTIDERVLDGDKISGEPDVKELIAMFASGKEDDLSAVDPEFATQVLQRLGEGNEMSECMICTGEIEGEVILPCYHNG